MNKEEKKSISKLIRKIRLKGAICAVDEYATDVWDIAGAYNVKEQLEDAHDFVIECENNTGKKTNKKEITKLLHGDDDPEQDLYRLLKKMIKRERSEKV